MPSLLDKVLSSRDSPSADQILAPADDKPHVLEDGSVVYDSTIAAVNRVFAVNPHLYKIRESYGVYKLYNAGTKISLRNVVQMYSLIKGDWEPKTKFQLAWFCTKVVELAPLLSFDCFIISDELIWDKETCTLRRASKEETKRSK